MADRQSGKSAVGGAASTTIRDGDNCHMMSGKTAQVSSNVMHDHLFARQSARFKNLFPRRRSHMGGEFSEANRKLRDELSI